MAQNTVLRSETITADTKKKHLRLDAGHSIFFQPRLNKITQIHPDMGNEIHLNDLWFQNMIILSKSMLEENQAAQAYHFS